MADGRGARNWCQNQPGYRGIAQKVISYEYSVDGKRYTSQRYSFGYLAGGITGGGEMYAKLRRELPNRPRVTVFYNPTKPEQSLLVPGASWIHALNFTLSGGVLALMLALIR